MRGASRLLRPVAPSLHDAGTRGGGELHRQFRYKACAQTLCLYGFVLLQAGAPLLVSTLKTRVSSYLLRGLPIVRAAAGVTVTVIRYRYESGCTFTSCHTLLSLAASMADVPHLYIRVTYMIPTLRNYMSVHNKPFVMWDLPQAFIGLLQRCTRRGVHLANTIAQHNIHLSALFRIAKRLTKR